MGPGQPGPLGFPREKRAELSFREKQAATSDGHVVTVQIYLRKGRKLPVAKL